MHRSSPPAPLQMPLLLNTNTEYLTLHSSSLPLSVWFLCACVFRCDSNTKDEVMRGSAYVGKVLSTQVLFSSTLLPNWNRWELDFSVSASLDSTSHPLALYPPGVLVSSAGQIPLPGDRVSAALALSGWLAARVSPLRLPAVEGRWRVMRLAGKSALLAALITHSPCTQPL